MVLVRPDGGGFYLLDELGALIWQLCDGAHSLGQVIAEVGEALGSPKVAVAGDVREWIAELRAEGLLLAVD